MGSSATRSPSVVRKNGTTRKWVRLVMVHAGFGKEPPVTFDQTARGHDTDSGRRTRPRFLGCCEAGRLVRHESRRRTMARVAGHLSVEDLEAGFRSARDPTAARHFQVIWLLARGHTIADVA